MVDVNGISGVRQYLTYVNPYFRIFGECMLGVFLCECMPMIQDKLNTNGRDRLFFNKSFQEIVVSIIFFGFFLAEDFIKSSVWSAWIWFVPIVLVMIVFYPDQGIVSGWMKDRPWQFLGDISFELYMTHAFVNEGLPIIVGIVSPAWREWIVYHAGTRFLITLILSIIVAWIVHVVLNWIMNKSGNNKSVKYEH